MNTPPSARTDTSRRHRVDGKFLEVGGRRVLVKGVTYGTFAPGADGGHFPERARVDADFAAMAAAGLNTVRTYTVPTLAFLDAAARHGLHVIVGMPWPQHRAFLDDARLVRQIRHDARATLRRLASHPASLLFAVGNEIPPGVVRWHGHQRVERFLRALYDDLKTEAPASLLTYVNYPPTDYLDVECFDVCAFNVYLHREADLRAYLVRLQHIAGPRPLLLAEAGGDSLREGVDGQALITAMHIRAALAEGACGAVAFSWTDEWWRGGHTVADWAFGLVDADRRPKPALAAVSKAFADAPFPAHETVRWPRASVIVCAYNAADTIDECLASLDALTYPNAEIIVVNDGSSDATAALARRHGRARVIDVPHGGLSAARNAGLAAASGEIIAYTDADVRVDPDWLTYLVQPLLTSDVVGAGGPNVAPHDDPWMAQCVARAPGGPTHVLLDDRIAEHVPGCNMAFRREALLAIDGFNPVFLRAGDDVDVCWRLQAGKLRIGFAPAALVWHRHRSTIDAFWRQQVGYGEAEAWLNAHYPDKFSGGQMLWHGRIYSALPFVRALRGRRVNTGVWGTAAFPSVYWVGAPAWQFLPHAPVWMALASGLLVFGVLGLPGLPAHATWLLLAGAAGWLMTLIRCLVLAQRSDLGNLPRIGRLPRSLSRIVYRATIAWLHVLQPLARMRGRLKGAWSLPRAGERERMTAVTEPPWDAAPPSLGDARGSGRLLVGLAEERSFWSESWLAHTTLLSELAALLRASRPSQVVHLDDGWQADRDLSLAVSRWGYLDAQVLVEEHAEGRSLLRFGVRFRMGAAGMALAAGLVGLVTGGAAAMSLGWRWLGVALLAAAGAACAHGAWRTVKATAVLKRALARATATAGLLALPVSSAPPARAHRRWRSAAPARALQMAALLGTVAFGVGRLSSATDPVPGGDTPTARTVASDAIPTGGGIAVGIAGDVFVTDVQQAVIRRLRPRPPAGASWSAADIGTDGDPVLGTAIPLDGAADLALALNGDLYVADVRRHRIHRVVPSTGEIDTIAGTASGGFDGDGGDALRARLQGPSAIGIAHNGDLYVADTLNNRIRLITHATGRISTVAGDGREGTADDVGDGGPAVLAHLNRPMGMAIAPNGDLYIADTGHHRVRRVSAGTGVISTVAGDGTSGRDGDGGAATGARLAAPMGLALAASGHGAFLYIADSLNDRVRAIDPGGRISTLTGAVPVLSPTRIAYHPAGWLYVTSGRTAGVTALSAPLWPAVAGGIPGPSLTPPGGG